MPAPSPSRSQRWFRDVYADAMAAHIRGASENTLSRAYELGRSALARGTSLPEIAATHSASVAKTILRADSATPHAIAQRIRSAQAFFIECIAPYEMTHRGYNDAMSALRQVNETLESEIRRFAHVLHDESGQLLAAIHLAVSELENAVGPGASGHFETIRDLFGKMEDRLRQLSHELHPTILDDLGWRAAIEYMAANLARRYSVPIQVSTGLARRFSIQIETLLYRVAHEALRNAVTHAAPTRIGVQIDLHGATILCSVADDGCGFESAEPTPGDGLGLRGMRDRVRAAGGEITISSAPGRGTTVVARIPLGTS